VKILFLWVIFNEDIWNRRDKWPLIIFIAMMVENRPQFHHDEGLSRCIRSLIINYSCGYRKHLKFHYNFFCNHIWVKWFDRITLTMYVWLAIQWDVKRQSKNVLKSSEWSV
jgi:hypothetical protein